MFGQIYSVTIFSLFVRKCSVTIFFVICSKMLCYNLFLYLRSYSGGSSSEDVCRSFTDVVIDPIPGQGRRSAPEVITPLLDVDPLQRSVLPY